MGFCRKSLRPECMNPSWPTVSHGATHHSFFLSRVRQTDWTISNQITRIRVSCATCISQFPLIAKYLLHKGKLFNYVYIFTFAANIKSRRNCRRYDFFSSHVAWSCHQIPFVQSIVRSDHKRRRSEIFAHRKTATLNHNSITKATKETKQKSVNIMFMHARPQKRVKFRS